MEVKVSGQTSPCASQTESNTPMAGTSVLVPDFEHHRGPGPGNRHAGQMGSDQRADDGKLTLLNYVAPTTLYEFNKLSW